jgi:putative glutamine amidotransferase
MGSTPVIGITTYAPRKGLERFHLPRGVRVGRAARRSAALADPARRAARGRAARAPRRARARRRRRHRPACYGGAPHPELYGISPERDALEIELARTAFQRRLPTLGICRGCQIVNVAFGGNLIEHLPDEVGDEVAHRGETPGSSTLHAVELTRGSRVAEIVGDLFPRTSSSHHQALRRVAAGLEVVGRAPDGTIEAVERRDHPFYLAVQWHPEETAAEDPGQQRLFDALVAAARARR